MINIFAIILGLVTILLMLLALWYYLKSVVVMGKRHILLGGAALFFAPIAQLVYYLAEKANLSVDERKILLRSVWIWFAITVMGVLAAILLPMMQPAA